MSDTLTTSEVRANYAYAMRVVERDAAPWAYYQGEFDAWLKKHDEEVILRYRIDDHMKRAKNARAGWWEYGDVNDRARADFHEDQADILRRKLNNDN